MWWVLEDSGIHQCILRTRNIGGAEGGRGVLVTPWVIGIEGALVLVGRIFVTLFTVRIHTIHFHLFLVVNKALPILDRAGDW